MECRHQHAHQRLLMTPLQKPIRYDTIRPVGQEAGPDRQTRGGNVVIDVRSLAFSMTLLWKNIQPLDEQNIHITQHALKRKNSSIAILHITNIYVHGDGLG